MGTGWASRSQALVVNDSRSRWCFRLRPLPRRMISSRDWSRPRAPTWRSQGLSAPSDPCTGLGWWARHGRPGSVGGGSQDGELTRSPGPRPLCTANSPRWFSVCLSRGCVGRYPSSTEKTQGLGGWGSRQEGQEGRLQPESDTRGPPGSGDFVGVSGCAGGPVRTPRRRLDLQGSEFIHRRHVPGTRD